MKTSASTVGTPRHIEVPLPLAVWMGKERLGLAPVLVDEVAEWCRFNFQDRWFTRQRFGPVAGDPDYAQVICFERTSDAVMFKLRWGER